MKEELKQHVVVVNANGPECLLHWVDGCLAPQVAPLEEHFPLEVKLREADWETLLFNYTWLDHCQRALPAKLDEILQDVIDIVHRYPKLK